MVPGALKVCIHPAESRLGRSLIVQAGKRLLSVIAHSVQVAGRLLLVGGSASAVARYYFGLK
jgi:hypothetical protein